MRRTWLSTLGNQSLFIGGGVSIAGNFDEFDNNCIYFVEDLDYSSASEHPLVSRRGLLPFFFFWQEGVFYLDDALQLLSHFHIVIYWCDDILQFARVCKLFSKLNVTRIKRK